MKAYATPAADLLYVESADVITNSPYIFGGLFEDLNGNSVGQGESISFDAWSK